MLALFAQQQPKGDPAAAAGMAAGILIFYGIIIVVAIAIQVCFLLSMSKCFKAISPRNRQMEPGKVWLALIPIFGLVWTIIMILKLSDSLRDEYDDRGMRGDGDFGKTLGIVYIVSSFICGPVALITFIMYWVKVAGYSKALLSRGGGRYDDDDDDDEDDRPRKRRRRDDDDDDDDRPRRRRRSDDDDDDE